MSTSRTPPQGPDVLEPQLTAWDTRVLAALAPIPALDDPQPRQEWRSEWTVAEAVGEDDVAYVRSTLRGLGHRHLAYSTYRKHKWARTERGDSYLENQRV